MILFLLVYLGGVLTIISPCILPVLPFVFARSDRPFVSSGLPMLTGMAATFAAVATLAAVGGGWAVQANEYGRYVALALLAVFGITLLFPALSDMLTRPVLRWVPVCPRPQNGALEPAVRASCRHCCWGSRQACFGRRVPDRCSV